MSKSEGTLIYPRLGRETSLAIIRVQSSADLYELENLGSTGHPDAAPAPSGGHPVEEGLLKEIQLSIRESAAEAGYPNAPRPSQRQAFDRSCGCILFRSMKIVTADAADEGVWSFFSLVLTPEIGPWRFPKRPEERLLGKPRNVFRRLWWRAWAFGERLEFAPDGCAPLGEDEFVQVMERPSLGGNPRLAGALRQAIWRAEAAGLSTARSDMMRELARRLRAVRSHVALDVLDNVQLTDLMDEILDAAHLFLCGKPLQVLPLVIEEAAVQPPFEVSVEPSSAAAISEVEPAPVRPEPAESLDDSIDGLVNVFQARHSFVSKSELRDLRHALPGWLDKYSPSTIRTAIGKSSTLGDIEYAAERIHARLGELQPKKRSVNNT